MILPVSTVIPTRNRWRNLQETLTSLLAQTKLPAEIIVIDASDTTPANNEIEPFIHQALSGGASLRWEAASLQGAAPQRNQGYAFATQPFVHFMDDDIIMEQDCLQRLWGAMQSSAHAGGVSAMIANEKYHPPGPFSRWLFAWLNGEELPTYAGRCLGCGLTLMPSDDPALPEIVPVDWLVTGCVIYRREAMPDPPFPARFTGASLAEDLALSLRVGKKWGLFNARNARVFHQAPGGDHKRDLIKLSEMEVLNRHYVMKYILERDSWYDYVQFWFVNFITLIRPGDWKSLLARLIGRLRAAIRLQ